MNPLDNTSHLEEFSASRIFLLLWCNCFQNKLLIYYLLISLLLNSRSIFIPAMPPSPSILLSQDLTIVVVESTIRLAML
jgi:hypothetical protein